jgi:hypothetical protein
MLHAVVRSERDAFHFFGEVTPYNLQTLRQHVRDRAWDGGALSVRFEIDAEDQSAFVKYAGKWLPKLRGAGNVVEVTVAGVPVRARMEPASSRASLRLAAAS